MRQSASSRSKLDNGVRWNLFRGKQDPSAKLPKMSPRLAFLPAGTVDKSVKRGTRPDAPRHGELRRCLNCRSAPSVTRQAHAVNAGVRAMARRKASAIHRLRQRANVALPRTADFHYQLHDVTHAPGTRMTRRLALASFPSGASQIFAAVIQRRFVICRIADSAARRTVEALSSPRSAGQIGDTADENLRYEQRHP